MKDKEQALQYWLNKYGKMCYSLATVWRNKMKLSLHSTKL
jgi:hypothetical protein